MENEYYIKNELQSLMDKFIEENCEDIDFGYMPENLTKKMAEAAYLILEANKTSQEFYEEQI